MLVSPARIGSSFTRFLIKLSALSAWEKERAKEAKERQAEAGGDKKSEKAKSLSLNLHEPIEPIRTAAEVAAKIGSTPVD